MSEPSTQPGAIVRWSKLGRSKAQNYALSEPAITYGLRMSEMRGRVIGHETEGGARQFSVEWQHVPGIMTMIDPEHLRAETMQDKLGGAILDDITDRRGWSQEWDQFDGEVRDEIAARLPEVALRSLRDLPERHWGAFADIWAASRDPGDAWRLMIDRLLDDAKR